MLLKGRHCLVSVNCFHCALTDNYFISEALPSPVLASSNLYCDALHTQKLNKFHLLEQKS